MPSPLEFYEEIEVIGKGTYGVCKRIKRKSDGKIMVWKEVNYSEMSENEKDLICSEVNLLRCLKHKHIVRYHDRIIHRTKATIYIVMEYCPGGDLNAIIKAAKRESALIPEEFIWKILGQTSLALQALHTKAGVKAVLHRDLKPANIFLDENGDVKLGDFGLARILHRENSVAESFVGTPYYMSPELMGRNAYSQKSDIWSLGCVVYELCALHPPFLAKNQVDLEEKIRKGTFSRIPKRYSDKLFKVISACLSQKQDRRPTVQDLLAIPEMAVYLDEEVSAASSNGSGDGHASATFSDSANKQSAKEEEIKKEMAKLKEFESRLLAQETKLKKLEKELSDKEADLKDRETSQRLKTKQLRELEDRLMGHEKALKLREQALNKTTSQNKPALRDTKGRQRRTRALAVPEFSSPDTDSEPESAYRRLSDQPVLRPSSSESSLGTPTALKRVSFASPAESPTTLCPRLSLGASPSEVRPLMKPSPKIPTPPEDIDDARLEMRRAMQRLRWERSQNLCAASPSLERPQPAQRTSLLRQLQPIDDSLSLKNIAHIVHS